MIEIESETELFDQDEADASIFGFDAAPAADARGRGMPGPQVAVDSQTLQQIIEGAILAANQPVSVARLTELFEEDFAPSKTEIEAALAAIGEQCAGRGFELKEVASGWRFQVRDTLAPWVNRLWEEKPQRYSRALLETLSLIAYRQPLTRGDIEEIRGVAVSTHIIKTLLERDWVKVVGQRDVPGRPSLYATTRRFLDYFNLKSLDQLPSLSEIRDIDEIAPELDLAGAFAPMTASTNAPTDESLDEQPAALAQAGDTDVDTNDLNLDSLNTSDEANQDDGSFDTFATFHESSLVETPRLDVDAGPIDGATLASPSEPATAINDRAAVIELPTEETMNPTA